ncbi:MAG: glucokinase [Kiloniellales bacterium]|nr:glucokinase [Kiloniellales bacterium]
MHQDPVLLGDIGGTNARFALAHDGTIEMLESLRVAEHPTAGAALAEVLRRLPGIQPRRAVFACAGPVEAGAIALTNCAWRLEERELEARFAFERVLLVNDFAAVAWALPHLEAGQLLQIGPGEDRPGRPRVVLGPGTGLGVAAFLPAPLGPQVITGEGGHVTLPAADDREAEVLRRLRAKLGHVSAERLLSGSGLVRLYETLAGIDGLSAPPRSAPEITAAAAAGDCAASRTALEMFCAMLGGFAGNLALTWGAQGGIYVAGGIAPRIAEDLAASAFRQRFEAKGRFQPYLEEIPTRIVLHPEPAFLGLSRIPSVPA